MNESTNHTPVASKNEGLEVLAHESHILVKTTGSGDPLHSQVDAAMRILRRTEGVQPLLRRPRAAPQPDRLELRVRTARISEP